MNNSFETMKEAIDAYLDRGFGSMNKNDFEVFIFNEIIKDADNASKSDFEISKHLRIPESKVKRLRYEANLKYPIPEEDLKRLFKESLSYCKLIAGNTRSIEISIENKMVRNYVNELLKKDHRFGDSSFNSEIVRITPSDYEFLIKSVYKEKEVEKTEKAIIEYLESTDYDFSKDHAISDIIEMVGEKIDKAVPVCLQIARLAVDTIRLFKENII